MTKTTLPIGVPPRVEQFITESFLQEVERIRREYEGRDRDILLTRSYVQRLTVLRDSVRSTRIYIKDENPYSGLGELESSIETALHDSSAEAYLDSFEDGDEHFMTSEEIEEVRDVTRAQRAHESSYWRG